MPHRVVNASHAGEIKKHIQQQTHTAALLQWALSKILSPSSHQKLQVSTLTSPLLSRQASTTEMYSNVCTLYSEHWNLILLYCVFCTVVCPVSFVQWCHFWNFLQDQYSSTTTTTTIYDLLHTPDPVTREPAFWMRKVWEETEVWYANLHPQYATKQPDRAGSPPCYPKFTDPYKKYTTSESDYSGLSWVS